MAAPIPPPLGPFRRAFACFRVIPKGELDRPARHKTLHWAESAHPPKRRCPSQTLSSPAKGGKKNTPSATRSPKCTYINIFSDETYSTLRFVYPIPDVDRFEKHPNSLVSSRDASPLNFASARRDSGSNTPLLNAPASCNESPAFT